MSDILSEIMFYEPLYVDITFQCKILTDKKIVDIEISCLISPLFLNGFG